MTHRARVAEISPLAGGMMLLSLDVSGTPLREQYRRVGQYVILSTAESPPGFFSLASAPDEARFLFLIKVEKHNPKTAELAKLQPGDTVNVSDVQGPGYPVFVQKARDLLFVATGTGIAPIRAVLSDLAHLRRDFGKITLVYGAVKEEALAFRSDWAKWADMGVELVIVLSRPSSAWKGHVGYVQDVLRKIDFAPEHTSAFLCGQKAMTHKVADILVERGVHSSCIFENR